MVTVTAAQCAVCLWALAQMSLCDFMAQRERKLKVVLTLDCLLKGFSLANNNVVRPGTGDKEEQRAAIVKD